MLLLCANVFKYLLTLVDNQILIGFYFAKIKGGNVAWQNVCKTNIIHIC